MTVLTIIGMASVPDISRISATLKTVMICVVLAALAVTGWVLWQRFEGSGTVKSYRDCVMAGNQVQTSYPGVCVTKDGRSYADPANKVYQAPSEGGMPTPR